MDTDDIKEFKHGHRTLVFNLCVMSHKCQSRFLQTYQSAVKNGIDPIKFVKTWNHYAQDISEHVFWEVKEPQQKFVERGK